MKIQSITSLSIPDVKIIRFARFADDRGYFTETLRVQDLQKIEEIPFFRNAIWHQTNESYSLLNVVRGLHFQWNPHMGKLVRATDGKLTDIAVDIRTDSSTFGKAICQELHFNPHEDHQELLWIPPGFAHGFVAIEECRIEYMCTGWWSPDSERAITILDPTIDWSLADGELHTQVRNILPNAHMTNKDRDGLTLKQWKESKDAVEFMESLPQVT